MNSADSFLDRHLEELASRAWESGRCIFGPFLSPAEQEEARNIARRVGSPLCLYGGYEEAERKMPAFGSCEESDFPICAVAVSWPHQEAPEHRDLLGGLLGLGLKRALVGDIVFREKDAVVFLDRSIGDYIARQFSNAGRARLHVSLLEDLPPVDPPEGLEMSCTVMSLRLDCLVSAGFRLSRGRAEELIRSGSVKLRHVICQKCDERVKAEDAISARGFGRLVIAEIGNLTKKGRLPVKLVRYSQSGKK